AAAAYFLIDKFKGGSTVTEVPPAVTQPPLTTSNNPVIVDSGAGTGSHVIKPTPIGIKKVVDSNGNVVTANMPAVNTVAAGYRQALLRDAAAYPEITAAVAKMDSTELSTMYQYFYNFFLQGKTLYRYPDPSHPGDWNTALYDQVQNLVD